jgi:hypothetical protein
MARVTYGESVTEYAGSIGGVTFQKNASGNIARLRPNPTVNPLPSQAYYQNKMSNFVAAWHNLTNVQKTSWDDFAIAHDHTTPWGDVKTLTGFQWFLSCNLHRTKHIDTVIETAPAWFAYGAPPAFTIETHTDYIRAAWVPGYNGNNLLGYISLPLQQSSLKLRRGLFYVQKFIAVPEIDNWDFTTSFEDLTNVVWADFFASANCYIIIRILNGSIGDGLLSSFTSAIVKIN